MNSYYIYILTNKNNRVLYTGVTRDLNRRIYEHKQKLIKGFTAKYNVNKLVFFQEFTDINEAISIEKKIKGWLRAKKVYLINKFNPGWKDLSSSCHSEATPKNLKRGPSPRFRMTI